MQHQLKDVMSRDVKVISPEMTIREAAQTMCDGDFGMMPVGENDRMIGALSDRDIAIRAVAEGKGPTTKVREIMSTGVCWAYEDDTVEEAARLMSERQVRRPQSGCRNPCGEACGGRTDDRPRESRHGPVVDRARTATMAR